MTNSTDSTQSTSHDHTLWFAVKVSFGDNRVLSSAAIRDVLEDALDNKHPDKNITLLSADQDIWLLPLTGMTDAQISFFLDLGYFGYSFAHKLPVFIRPISDAIGLDQ